MRKNHFRHPLNFNLGLSPTIPNHFTTGATFYDSGFLDTKLNTKMIFVTGITGVVIGTAPADDLSYDLTDKITVGFDGVISNAAANTSDTKTFVKFNRPWYPFFLQLINASSQLRMIFYLAGGDWPGPAPSPDGFDQPEIVLSINMNIHFETEQP